jgi:putative ABC transport system permease protein
MTYFLYTIGGIVLAACAALLPFFLLLFAAERLLAAVNVGRSPKYLLIMLKSLRRNLLRTSLTYLAVFVLVIVITMIWSILAFLADLTEDKSKDLKAIVTEKHQLPSQMPFAYAAGIRREVQSLPAPLRPAETDLMTWQFYGGTLDLEKRTRENLLFFFAMEPNKLTTMMDDLEDLDPALVEKLQQNLRGAILGRERLEAANKKVGERMKVFSINYKDIDLEFDIVGVFPEGRYNQSAVMNRDYLNRALNDYERKNRKKHPLAEKTLNLVWLRLPNSEAFEMVAERLAAPGKFASPAVKVETASSGISSWLEAYRDLVWAMRWLLSPAILMTMSLVVANAISISVRERLTEMAVLKVLGFPPWQILTLVLGEALLIGTISGALSAGIAYTYVDYVAGGFKFPIAFFPAFFIPKAALWWGPVLGACTAAIGSFVPAWSARTVKVSEVFAKVA